MTTKMYNPDTQETEQVPDDQVDQKRGEGWIAVGGRAEQEFVGRSRDELKGIDEPPNMGQQGATTTEQTSGRSSRG